MINLYSTHSTIPQSTEGVPHSGRGGEEPAEPGHSRPAAAKAGLHHKQVYTPVDEAGLHY